MTFLSDTPQVALAIAGSDSGGGAGIQADLKAMSHRSVHGCTAITAVTAQNSNGVQGIEPVSQDVLREQIKSVTSDFSIDATKTGMLFNQANISVVMEEARSLGQLVVDPVMVAESGDSLLEDQAESILVEGLLPRADLVTPNWTESRRIAERLGLDPDRSPKDLARELVRSLDGPGVLIKGGHLEERQATDRLELPDGTSREYTAPRIDTENTHGSGCVYSSLITAELAKGKTMKKSISEAKRVLTDALRSGYAPGKGPGTLNLLRPRKQ